MQAPETQGRPQDTNTLKDIVNQSRIRIVFILLFTLLIALPGTVHSTVYQVGPGQTYENLQEVVDNVKLVGGDIVEVAGNVTYPGGVTFDSNDRGAPGNPIIIRGKRSSGQRPVLSGGTNTIHFSTWPVDQPGADHYVLEGFEITGGSSRCVFHQANDLTIRDTVVHDCPSQGILGADQGSGSLTMQYVEVYNCGNGTYDHQIYMATDEVHHPGSVFRLEYCYIHSGNGGNNVKTRAERNEIYYNWIEGAYYHELEMIGPDPYGAAGGWTPGMAREDSDVVGNVFRKTGSNAAFFVFRVGGDGTGESNGRYRFVNNTIIADQSAVFRLFHGVESIEMHNNVFHRQGGSVDIVRNIEVDWASGNEVIAGSNNWVSSGASNVPRQWSGTLFGTNPGFRAFNMSDFRPDSGSPLIDAGNNVPTSPDGYPFPTPLWPPVDHTFLTSQLSSMAVVETRTDDHGIDIGAYEAPCDITGSCVAPPVADFAAVPNRGDLPLSVQFTDTSRNTPTSWLWDFGDGVTSTVQNPLHIYTTQGIYTVTLTTTNGEGSDTERKSNYIRAGIESNRMLLYIPIMIPADRPGK